MQKVRVKICVGSTVKFLILLACPARTLGMSKGFSLRMKKVELYNRLRE